MVSQTPILQYAAHILCSIEQMYIREVQEVCATRFAHVFIHLANNSLLKFLIFSRTIV